MSEQSVSNWKRLFLEAGRAGLEAGGKPGPNSREQRLLAELEDVRAEPHADPSSSFMSKTESLRPSQGDSLSLERHGGHSHQGVSARILQRLLALTAAIWHNHHTRQPVLRSLTAYDR